LNQHIFIIAEILLLFAKNNFRNFEKNTTLKKTSKLVLK